MKGYQAMMILIDIYTLRYAVRLLTIFMRIFVAATGPLASDAREQRRQRDAD